MCSCGVLDTTQERWDHGVVLTDYFIILFIQLALFKRYTSVGTDVLNFYSAEVVFWALYFLGRLFNLFVLN